MIYKKKDVDKILEEIEQRENLSSTYNIDTSQSVMHNIQALSYQMLKAEIVSSMIREIQYKLKEVEQTDVTNSSLDIPTQCDNCFAKRDNSICWVCAFTGDMSESGFFQKYGVMENCPFLTQKRVDDFTYNLLQEVVSSSYQDYIDDLDNDWYNKIRSNLQQSIDNFFGDGSSD